MNDRKLGPGLAATAVLAVCVLAFGGAHPGMAQDNSKPPNPVLTNVVPDSDQVTIQATIRSIDQTTRKVVLVGRSGAEVTLTAGPNVRLQMLKPGDRVNATYYRSVAFVLAGPGTPVPEDQVSEMIARPAQAPGGIALRQTRMSGLVVGIDLPANSVDLVDPSGGGVYTVRVTDPARQAHLSKLKVGDTITAVVTETLAVSIEPAA